ncbi:hypothetical protein LTR96_011397 [Exophiala xenobiotica]|nr:hypothetical protein LTR92_011434 [Exophiala xenobiotica]KAK5263181.1 hypothetical protein LTR96_011397 [Exophiala xenobiotica]KAK5332477.1 hypothetical protein LTR98_011399 [Exophiala xenobiotica]KAK5400038.1 hypothetical protein LTR06_011304 [Exophiala xenobiotica]
MTDLGLAIYRHPDYWDSRSTPTRDRTGRPPQLLGTCRYASVNGHLGVAQSRRDDLEALGYMLVYFMRGRLPWQGTKANRDAKYLLVLEKRQATSASELCVDLPPPFEKYVHYVHNLHDEDLPDYQCLREMFDQLFREQGFERDNVFDWTIREFQRLESDAQEPLASKEDGTELLCDTAWNVTKAARRKRR